VRDCVLLDRLHKNVNIKIAL